MKKLLLLLAATLPLAASTVSVTVNGVTPQQAVLNIRASDNSACTIQVSENPSFTPVVNDVNETLFPGSSSCNRQGSIVSGNTYRMTVGFRGTATATGSSSDHLIYSRSLQVYTTHYVKVTLASGATATATFTTNNPPLGNSAPDYIPYNTNGFGNYGWPSQHYPQNVGKVDTTIDPLTGFQMNRITGPGMGQNDTSGISPVYIVHDNSNGGWSALNCQNPGDSYNLYTSQSSNYCTYTGAGGQANSLFIGFRDKANYILNKSGGNSGNALPGGVSDALGDLRLALNGLGDNLQACLTLDGSTCLDDPITITNQATDSSQTVPSTWPKPPFLDWNSPAIKAGYSSTFSGSTTNSGTAVTITDTVSTYDQTALLPPWAKTGMWVQMSDNTNYWDNFQIASISDARHFTLSGSIPGGHTYTTYTLQSFGLLLWKATGGTGTTKLGSMNTWWATDDLFNNGFEGNSNGTCYPAFSLGNDGAGGAINPIQAKTCDFQPVGGGNTMNWLWSPTTGEVRVYDIARSGSSRANGWNYSTVTGFMTHCGYDNSFLSVPYGLGTTSNSHYTCTTPNTNSTIMQEIKAAHPEIDINYWSSGGGNTGLIFNGEADSNGHEYALFVADTTGPNTAGQGVAYWEFVVDLSLPAGPGQVVQAHNSWSTLPLRFAATHYSGGPDADGLANGSSHIGVLISMGGPNSNGTGAGTVMAGQYGMRPVSVVNNPSGTVASSYAESCSADGVTDARWIAEESSDNSCYQVKVASEPVNETPPTGSWYGYPQGDLTPFSDPSLIGSRPGPWKHNSTSCPGGAGDNTTSHCYSSLVDSAEGDWLVVATIGGGDNGNWANDNPGAQYTNNEIDLVAKKTVNGDGTITFVLVRAPKTDFGTSNPNALMNIPSGFVLVEMLPGQETDGYFPFGKPFTKDNFLANLPIFTAHTDFWNANGLNVAVSTNDYRNYVRTMGESFAVHQFRVGTFPGILTQGWTGQSAEYHPFNSMPNPASSYFGNFPGLGINSPPQQYTQYHPGGRPDSADPNESQVAFDASPFGGSQGGADTLWNQAVTLVNGQSHTYAIADPAVTAPDGYGQVISDAPDPKRRETYAFAGPYLLQNISGPNSSISDSTPYSYCRTGKANECVPGSTVGQSYVSVPLADIDGACKISLFVSTPCFTPADPHHSYVYQFSIKGNDTFGVNWRRITMAYNGPTRNNNYWNAHGDPEGKYVYVQSDEPDGMLRQDIFAVKLPPFPQFDGIRRDTFIKIPVQVPAVTGGTANTVRIRFGYAEYGLDSNSQPLYCSSERREDCSTGTPPVSTDPYAWLSENPTWQDCTSGCTVNIPAISGRVLYYVIDRKISGTTTSGSLQSVVIN